MATNHWEDPEWRKYWGVDDDSFYDPFEAGDCSDADEVEGWNE